MQHNHTNTNLYATHHTLAQVLRKVRDQPGLIGDIVVGASEAGKVRLLTESRAFLKESNAILTGSCALLTRRDFFLALDRISRACDKTVAFLTESCALLAKL